MKRSANIGNAEQTPPPLTPLSQFTARIGVSPVTGWRWRKWGWLQTVNIAGKQYLTDEAIVEFKRRAEAGEFAREAKVPAARPAPTTA